MDLKGLTRDASDSTESRLLLGALLCFLEESGVLQSNTDDIPNRLEEIDFPLDKGDRSGSGDT